MVHYKSCCFIIILLIAAHSALSQGLVYGIITDEASRKTGMVNIAVTGLPLGTTTNEDGYFELKVPAGHEVELVISYMGYKTERLMLNLRNGEKYKIDYQLIKEDHFIGEVRIEDAAMRNTNLIRINPRFTSVIPDVSGNIEAIVKTLPGVRSNNELSSQYTVRGGNFDENLVYVNGIEVYRPFLVRSGQQEGLSFINPDMVSSVLFSAGGFEAKYGDKLSSVLDIQYKKPTVTRVNISASLLGSNLSFEGTSNNRRLTFIAGTRYKTNKYLLKSLDEQGSYNPRFFDFQTYVTYDLTEKIELAFLGNYSQNRYNFIPQDRETSFGTLNEALQLKIYFEGQEVDMFNAATNALSVNYQVNSHLKMMLTGSVFNTSEKETFDILSQYWINQLDNQSNAGDSVASIGVGSFLDHARNYLHASVYSLEYKGIRDHDIHILQWGIKTQQHQTSDKITEWKLIDSAGYSVPYNDTIISLNRYYHSKGSLISNSVQVYIQDALRFQLRPGNLMVNVGLRFNYSDLNQNYFITPRILTSFTPDWQRLVVFRLAGGWYYQPPFYKELRDKAGNIHTTVRPQQSFHLVAATDYEFRMWGRPFKIVAEAYYKHLTQLIPYDIDNVRIRYYGDNIAKGYATGIDLKINGEFVKGTDSWLSIGLMRTREDIINDSYKRDTVTVYPGYIPRPSDQLLNVGLFFQDYFPGNPAYKMNLNLHFATGLPFGPPDSDRYLATARMPAYRRVDIGFSRLINAENKVENIGFLSNFQSIWIGFEIFNLMDTKNTISYTWVTDIRSRQYAVPNLLTGRRYNVKLTATF